MKRSLVIVVAVILALAALLAGAAFRVYRLTKPNVIDLKNNLHIDQSQGELTILVAGVDEVDRVHRSDSILLVRIDLDHKRVKVMSVPRDSRVTIHGHGQQKINAAYAFGGISLLRDTVVNLTGAPVNYSAVINYSAFPKLIDAVGGVELNVPKKMVYTDKAQKLYINFAPGPQHLNGEQSLKFVRFRHDALGDEGRMKRQQLFLQALLTQVQKPSVALNLPSAIASALDLVKTDIPSETAVQLASYLKDIRMENVELFTMPGKAAYIKGLSYWIPDLQEAGVRFNTWPELAEEPAARSTESQPTAESSTPPSAPKEQNAQNPPHQKNVDTKAEATNAENPEPTDKNGQLKIIRSIGMPLAVLNGTGKAGLSKQGAQLFEKLGVTVEYQGNAKHYDYHYSVVHFPAGQRENAIRLAKFFNIPLNLVSQRNVPQVSLVLGQDYERLFNQLKSIPLEQ